MIASRPNNLSSSSGRNLVASSGAGGLEELRQKFIKETPNEKKDFRWLDYVRAEMQKYAQSQ